MSVKKMNFTLYKTYETYDNKKYKIKCTPQMLYHCKKMK